jgi:hypothetical protein
MEIFEPASTLAHTSSYNLGIESIENTASNNSSIVE